MQKINNPLSVLNVRESPKFSRPYGILARGTWLYRGCAMKNMQYNRYCRNSSVIVDLAMGQNTEHISSS